MVKFLYGFDDSPLGYTWPQKGTFPSKLTEERVSEDLYVNSADRYKVHVFEPDDIHKGKQAQYIVKGDTTLAYTKSPHHNMKNNNLDGTKSEWKKYFQLPFDCECFNPASLFLQDCFRDSFVYLGKHGVGAWKTGTVASDVVLVNLTK